MMKKLLSNLLASLLSLVLLFVFLEIGVRLLVPDKYYLVTQSASDWDGDSELGWKNKPNYEDVAIRHGKLVDYKTNQDGFRPATAVPQKKEGCIRVMLFGNSTVNAREVPANETIHFYLDSLLNLGAQRYEVINAGVLGYATDQTLLNIERNLDIYSPDIVCYGYCINDLYVNASGEYSGLYKPYFQLENDSLVLMPMEKQNTDILGATRSFSIADLLQYSAFWGLLRPYVQKAKIRFSKQAELDQGGMNEIELYERPIADNEHFVRLAKLVERMGRSCVKKGASFFFYPHPEVVTVWPPYRNLVGKENLSPFIIENKLQEIATLDSVEFVGMVDHFLKNENKGPFHLLPVDPHCNSTGYLLQAEVLSAHIRDMAAQN